MSKLLRKLSAMMALAESAKGTNEGEIARRKAEEYACRLGIDLDDGLEGERRMHDADCDLWCASLLAVVATHTGCAESTEHPGVLEGLNPNLDRAEYLYVYLHRSIDSAAHWFAFRMARSQVSYEKLKEGFALGAVVGLMMRMVPETQRTEVHCDAMSGRAGEPLERDEDGRPKLTEADMQSIRDELGEAYEEERRKLEEDQDRVQPAGLYFGQQLQLRRALVDRGSTSRPLIEAGDLS